MLLDGPLVAGREVVGEAAPLLAHLGAVLQGALAVDGGRACTGVRGWPRVGTDKQKVGALNSRELGEEVNYECQICARNECSILEQLD